MLFRSGPVNTTNSAIDDMHNELMSIRKQLEDSAANASTPNTVKPTTMPNNRDDGGYMVNQLLNTHNRPSDNPAFERHMQRTNSDKHREYGNAR